MGFNAAFLKLQADLPRHGVGSDLCTQEAIDRLPPLRKPPSVIDVGCGSGHQTILLAKRFKNKILAVDHCQTFLDELTSAARDEGVERWIETCCRDIADIVLPKSRFDLLWCEDAIREIGWAKALRMWSALLRPRGVVAVSDCTWLGPAPNEQVQRHWETRYPTMETIEGNAKIAKAAGFAVFDHFALPRASWWDSYYGPLSRRIRSLEADVKTDPALASAVREAKDEIAVFESNGDSFGYVFYLMRLN